MKLCRHLLAFVFAWSLMFTLSGRASAQPVARDAWDVIAAYSCSFSGSDATERLFLLPDLSWSYFSPFTPQYLRLRWISAQSRHFIGVLPLLLKPEGKFRFEDKVIKLFNVEEVDYDPSAAHFGRMKDGLLGSPWKLDRPSALPKPEPQQWFDMVLVQTFRPDPGSGLLEEVLPARVARQPERCEKEPLFAEELSH